MNYVLGFVHTKYEVLLCKKKKGPEINIDKLNGIGGKIEQGESALLAMHREGMEEAGVNVDWKEFGYMWGEGYSVRLYQAQQQLIRIPETNDVGEPLLWVQPEKYINDMGQNVYTMISHIFYGSGSLVINA